MAKRADHSSLATSPTLLTQLQQESHEAWVRLVKLYSPRMTAWCFTKGLDATSTQDILQETWISVGKSIGRFESNAGQGAFRAWLHRILNRRIADYYRRMNPHPTCSGGYSVVGKLVDTTVTDRCAEESSVSAMANALNPRTALKLPEVLKEKLELARRSVDEKTWAIFSRSVLDGGATERVAQEFSVSPANVRQIRSRVLRKLRIE